MKQIVDPFMPVSRPANNMSASMTVSARRTSGQSQTSVSALASNQKVAHSTPNRSGNIDGVVPRPQRPGGYRGPAGSLHLQYVKAPQPTVDARRAGGRQPASDVRPAVQASASQAQSQVQAAKLFTATSESKPKAAKSTSKLKKDSLSTAWLVVGAAVAGLAMFSVLAGQVAIAVYAVVALWRRWPSQQSFMLALVMFGGIITALVIPNFKAVADNLAVYAFLLLAIGTISLAREARRDMRQIASD